MAPLTEGWMSSHTDSEYVLRPSLKASLFQFSHTQQWDKPPFSHVPSFPLSLSFSVPHPLLPTACLQSNH